MMSFKVNTMVVNLTKEMEEELKRKYRIPHLSGNSSDTIYSEFMSNSTMTKSIIHIPAERYNIPKFLQEGVIVYTGEGSYANEIEEQTGGFSGQHFHQTRDVVNRTLRQFIYSIDKSKYDVVIKGDKLWE